MEKHISKERKTGSRLPKMFVAGLLLAGIGGMLAGTSCDTRPSDPVSSEPPESAPVSEPEKTVADLAENCPYFYEYGCIVSGDDHLNALTSPGGGEVVLKPREGLDDDGKPLPMTFKSSDWNKTERELDIPNDCAVLSVDLGCLCGLTGFEIDGSADGCSVFTSTDGYNFSFYQGEFGKTGEFRDLTAKAVQFLIPYKNGEVKLKKIKISGTRAHERKLLSAGAKYTGTGNPLKAYPDDGTRLTDGKLVSEAGEDTVTGFQGSEVDPVTRKSGVCITVDLGETKNVSDVLFGRYVEPDSKNTLPDRIAVRLSEDGNTWTDFGQSYLRTSSGVSGTASSLYFVTHPETVKGRYVKIFTYTARFLTDEIRVYGYDEEVGTGETYGQRPVLPSDLNAAAFKTCLLNGEETPDLTDRTYADSVRTKDGDNEIRVKLGKKCSVHGFEITHSGSFDSISFEDGKGNRLSVRGETVSDAGSRTDRTWVTDPADAEEVVVRFTGDDVRICEVSVYASAPQLPIVRGGFFQLPLGGASTDNASNNSPYSWYLQLKGMRDLGMEYFVLQYGASFTDKNTIVNGKRITAAGYRYTATYGSEDVPGAILDAADKLGMKVWLGTIHGADFTQPAARSAQYASIVEDGIKVIEDIQEMYGSHPSFAGFYLADEQCDQWLNLSGGVAAARTVYKGQSDRIRELNPKATVMIAPAIWRSGTPATGADNLYRAIASSDGGRPVVDIVAEQDCLGRTSTLTVDRSVYSEYERYCAEWAKAVRRAGAEFWHDAEVFEITSTAKRSYETIKSLGIESKMSGNIIVFDIPHYMTLFQSASYDNLRSLYMLRQTRDYAKYAVSVLPLDVLGEVRDPGAEKNDGRIVEVPKEGGEKGEVLKDVYRPGVIRSTSEPANWQKFQLPNGKSTPEYAFAFDEEAFVVSVKPFDDTDSTQSGVWWSGDDDLLQIWMMPNGKTTGSVLQEEWGVRYYLHKTKTGWTAGGETGSSKTALSKFTFEVLEESGTEVLRIRMPWEAIGLLPPEAGDGTAIGIVLQYIDGDDKSWAASDGTKGQNIPDSALYSF
ncbi:MAG: DUF4434 domain-containing protein [Clostridia bacterium]|nr:DUF4434 domain-containing protein [Clostridia bacterium]